MDKTLLSVEELIKVEQGEALDKDYFYVPVITYSETSVYEESMWYSLRFDCFDRNPTPASLLRYASKVPAGQTLWQAVRRDLEKDFKYPHDKSFVIESATSYDTAKNKSDEELTRVIVDVCVNEKFTTREVHPLGMQLAWCFEGESLFGPKLGIEAAPKNDSSGDQ